MVLGESQIASQVRDAVRTARRRRRRRAALTGLFHAATRAGRRVRQETALGAAPDAFVALGTDLAAEALGGAPGPSAVVVVGAGPDGVARGEAPPAPRRRPRSAW